MYADGGYLGTAAAAAAAPKPQPEVEQMTATAVEAIGEIDRLRKLNLELVALVGTVELAARNGCVNGLDESWMQEARAAIEMAVSK